MNNLEKLESVIHRFIEQYNDLIRERENAVQEATATKLELHKAHDTIQELESSLARLENKLTDFASFENEKKDIISRIESIICRIDTINIDEITNEQ